MCTDETRQEILFLMSFPAQGEDVDGFEISKKMKCLIVSLKWPGYLLRSPNTIEQIIEESTKFSHIQKITPNTWQITTSGQKRFDYLLSRYIPEEERNNIRQHLKIAA